MLPSRARSAARADAHWALCRARGARSRRRRDSRHAKSDMRPDVWYATGDFARMEIGESWATRAHLVSTDFSPTSRPKGPKRPSLAEKSRLDSVASRNRFSRRGDAELAALLESRFETRNIIARDFDAYRADSRIFRFEVGRNTPALVEAPRSVVALRARRTRHSNCNN